MIYDRIKPKIENGIVNVIIEIPAGSNVKYEFDEQLKAIVVDRFSTSSMAYPCNYGFIPNTTGGDSDPIDVLIITRVPLIPGVVIKGKVIGILEMSDEGGEDAKIICVPVSKCDKFYDNVNSYKDLPENDIKKIEHFFEHYKDLDEGKWVKVQGWNDVEKANRIIQESIGRCAANEEKNDER